MTSVADPAAPLARAHYERHDNLWANAGSVFIPGTQAGDRFVEIAVQDNGIGFEEKFAEQIFVVFQRLHSRDEYEGTGIGLTIVRKAAERMGAQVGFESELGKGSRFWIQFQKGYTPV